MSTRWTREQLLAYESKRGSGSVVKPPSKAVEQESDLHADIAAECLRRGWIGFHGSMAHKTHRTVGEPDFVILVDGGRILLVECKAKGKKQTTDQMAIEAWAKKLGHTYWLVYSLEEFLTRVNAFSTQS